MWPTLSDAADSASSPPPPCLAASPTLLTLTPLLGLQTFFSLKKCIFFQTPQAFPRCTPPPPRHTHPAPIPVGHQFTDSSGTPPCNQAQPRCEPWLRQFSPLQRNFPLSRVSELWQEEEEEEKEVYAAALWGTGGCSEEKYWTVRTQVALARA